VLHRDGHQLFVQVEDANHARVFEAGRGARLYPKPLARGQTAPVVDLQGHVTLDASVASEEDGPGSAATEVTEDTIAASREGPVGDQRGAGELAGPLRVIAKARGPFTGSRKIDAAGQDAFVRGERVAGCLPKLGHLSRQHER
jgi:hypothetical protein